MGVRCACWGCIGGIFVATRSPDGWLIQGSVFILRPGDIGRFVIPWRCRVFHIAPHPWDHISSPHPQSPNRFIYSLSSCTYTSPSNTCIRTATHTPLVYTHTYKHTCWSAENHKCTSCDIKRMNVHDTLVTKCTHCAAVLSLWFQWACSTYFPLTFQFGSTDWLWWSSSCSHIWNKINILPPHEEETKWGPKYDAAGNDFSCVISIKRPMNLWKESNYSPKFSIHKFTRVPLNCGLPALKIDLILYVLPTDVGTWVVYSSTYSYVKPFPWCHVETNLPCCCKWCILAYEEWEVS